MIGQELGLLNDEAKLRVECLVLAQTFETFLAYYVQSDAQLFGRQCRDSGLKFLEVLDELLRKNPGMKDSLALWAGKDKDTIPKLREWLLGKNEYPYETSRESRRKLWTLVSTLKALLIIELGLTRFPLMEMSPQEQEYSEKYIKWRGHLPPEIIRNNNPETLVALASSKQTIVITGDIRKSQDLMTYSRSPSVFSKRMVEFITETRALLTKYRGFFDKFTGDGFLAYFNEAICSAGDMDYREASLEFLRSLLKFSSTHFSDWIKDVKKLPAEPVGLAIGADLGIVEFQNLSHHLIAVGDPIVWASRMASGARADEVVVNNLLYESLRDLTGIRFEERQGKTKSGEPFMAHCLLFSQET